MSTFFTSLNGEGMATYSFLRGRGWPSPPFFLMERGMTTFLIYLNGQEMATSSTFLRRKGSGHLHHFFLMEWGWPLFPVILREREWSPSPLLLMEGEWSPSALILMERFILMERKLYNGEGIAISFIFFLMGREWAPSSPLLMEKEWQPTHLLKEGRLSRQFVLMERGMTTFFIYLNGQEMVTTSTFLKRKGRCHLLSFFLMEWWWQPSPMILIKKEMVTSSTFVNGRGVRGNGSGHLLHFS